MLPIYFVCFILYLLVDIIKRQEENKIKFLPIETQSRYCMRSCCLPELKTILNLILPYSWSRFCESKNKTRLQDHLFILTFVNLNRITINMVHKILSQKSPMPSSKTYKRWIMNSKYKNLNSNYILVQHLYYKHM